MRNKSLGVLFIVFILTVFAIPVFAGKADNVCGNIDIGFLQRHVNLPQQVSIASKTPVNNLCQVILNINERYFTAYASDSFVMMGKMYSNRMLLDNPELAKLQKSTFTKVKPELDKCVAIDYKPEGKIKNVVYMITDPVCPYCDMATKKIKKFVDDHHAELKIVFFGVHGPASSQKAIEAVCRNFTLSEYTKEDWKKDDSKENQCQKGKDLIAKSQPVAKKLHIQGVPTFFLQNGTQVVGANMARLEKVIKN